MRIAFFDHPFHEKTKSSNFFLDLIYTYGKVEVFYVDFHDEKDVKTLLGSVCEQFDLLIFWQVIPPASILLKLPHKRIVLIPMYDACCTMTYSQWYAYRQYHFINFSSKLHTILSNMKMHSLYVKYVPYISNVVIKKTNQDLRAFIWKRTPSLNVSILLKSLERIGVKNVIFHDSYAGNPAMVPCKKRIEGLKIEYTNGWFDTHEEYLKTVTTCDIFVAPRLYEGIGMSFLEAMGLGLCVLAPNQATMNEYIIDGHNGILFRNFKSIGNKKIVIDDIKRQSKASFEECLNEWEKKVPDILTFLFSIKGEYKGHCIKPYFFVFEDVRIFFKIRLIPFVKRKMGLSDY